MVNRFASVAKVAAAGTAFGLLSACATVDEQQVGEMIDREMQDVNAEMEETRTMAQEAKMTAESAESTANEAHSTAEEALSKTEDNEEKIDRMFERTMQK